MRLAFIGDRGIPARYSGFSTLVEEVATRLVRDYAIEVTVYCRRAYFEQRPPMYRGVRCVYLPAPGGKSLESIVHSSLSILHAACRSFDLAFIVDPGNGPLSWPLKLRRTPVLFHTDGLGWQRQKWNRLQRLYYRWSERVCARLGTWLVTDSRAMQDYYRSQYNAESSFIPYGSHTGAAPDDACLPRYGLRKDDYLLVVARLEPENNTDLLIREFRASGVRRPLVVVGAARYKSRYYQRILAEADGHVKCLGSIWEPALLNGLYRNCYLYLHGHEVGGTNPSLLRAMGAGAASVPLGVVFHREVMGEEADYFDKTPGSLAELLRRLEADGDRVAALRRLALQRATSLYRWDAVTGAYASLFTAIVEARRARRPFGQTSFGDVYHPLEWAGTSEHQAVAAHTTAQPLPARV